jgi:anti-sigma factor ChrR (cupin superfamily)
VLNSRPRVIDTGELAWSPSPSPFVFRKRLEHSGPPEAGRVTSVVRYEPNSRFPPHPHPSGEEIFVLSGVFEDEHGAYPEGTFLLNPEGFEHAPFSRSGCELFVKLRQAPGARRHVHIDTNVAVWLPSELPGVERLPLYAEEGFPERIWLTRIAPGVRVAALSLREGEEVLVLAGSFSDEFGSYRKGTWLKYPAASIHSRESAEGCTLYVKSGGSPA